MHIRYITHVLLSYIYIYVHACTPIYSSCKPMWFNANRGPIRFAEDQFPVRRAGMFCFSLMLPFGYEVELLAWQYAHQAGCVDVGDLVMVSGSTIPTEAWEPWLIKEIIPFCDFLWPAFRLVKHYKLPRMFHTQPVTFHLRFSEHAILWLHLLDF